MYYTFSTVPQTLAGALALLGAFVIIRLNAFNHFIDSHVQNLYRKRPGGEEMREHYMRGDKPAMLRLYRRLQDKGKEKSAGDESAAPYLNGHYERLLIEAERMQARKTQLTGDTVRSLIVSAAVILVSFVLLAFTQLLCREPVAAGVCLAMVVGAAAYCIYLYVILLRKALREI